MKLHEDSQKLAFHLLLAGEHVYIYLFHVYLGCGPSIFSGIYLLYLNRINNNSVLNILIHATMTAHMMVYLLFSLAS